MKIRINNKDLAYTIDTYGMFNGESVEEQELDYYRYEYGMTEDELERIEYNYDHSGIVKDLSAASISLLHNEFVEHGDGIVKSIELDDTKSPRFYNYTTDSYTAFWDVDVEKLRAALKGRQQELDDFIREQWRALDVRDEYDEDYIVAMLDFWTRDRYSEDDYNMAMWEQESEIYIENMTLTKDSEKLVEQAIKRADEKRSQTELELEL